MTGDHLAELKSAEIKEDATFPPRVFSCLFVFEEEMAVNKHGNDSVEVLPVPIKLQRDHHNER